MLQAILVDLDDTLLQSDSERFMRSYFTALSERLGNLGDALELGSCLAYASDHMVCREHPEQSNAVGDGIWTYSFCRESPLPLPKAADTAGDPFVLVQVLRHRTPRGMRRDQTGRQ